ncbi:MlaD family protein [Roseovarius sp. SCSIO 43702]|nr:MlaD family protein [Roseovarius sp. SCSIO 43702]
MVWIVPLAALVVVLGVAWNAYAERGPLIEISFENASGINAGETEVRYRDVAVGLVEKVSFSRDLGSVIVSVRLSKDVAEFVDEEAKFWVVRPKVTTQGVSGLNTVLTGVYIEGVWDNEAGGLAPRFAGLSDPPLERAGQTGLRVQLRASGKVALTENAPIVYRGITVGRVGKTSISADGSTAEAEAMIFAPHDRLVTTATRFWDTSGFEFSIGPNGAVLDFSSLASLVSGGLTFGTIVSGGEGVTPGETFSVYADEADARASLFSGEEGDALNVSVIFDENVAGLAVDSAVELNGIQIGQVTAINGLVDPKRFGDNHARLLATLAIVPGRLGLDQEGDKEDAALDFLKERVAEGLRARLVTASILTGGLKVELIEVPDAPEEVLSIPEDGLPSIPTTESNISDVSASAEGVFKRINALPVEEVMNGAIELMASLNALASNEETRAVPGQINGLLSDARGLVNSEEVQAIPKRIAAVTDELEQVIAQINEQEVVARLGAAIDSASASAKSVSGAVEGVPELVEKIDQVAANLGKVNAEKLGNQLGSLIESADAILEQDTTKAIPENLNAALDEMRAVLVQLREGGVTENAVAALASARNAADSIAGSSDQVQALIRRAEGVLNDASVTIRGYQANGAVARDAREALREVQRAAQAVASLARAIERNPNSLLTGR